MVDDRDEWGEKVREIMLVVQFDDDDDDDDDVLTYHTAFCDLNLTQYLEIAPYTWYKLCMCK